MSAKLILLTLAVLGAVSVAVASCGGGDDGESDAGGESETRRIVIEARDTRFVPDEITVRAGEEVTLVLHNDDEGTDHDLQAQDLSVTLIGDSEIAEGHGGEGEGHGGDSGGDDVLALHAAEGEEMAVTFMADEPGTYRIFCTVDDHEEQGMVGVITVE